MAFSATNQINVLALLSTLGLWLLFASPSWADRWYEHYAKAEAAQAEERWSDAVDELIAAIAKRGDSSARARTYGMKVVEYFPYLELGVVYFHSGDFEASLEALETEERFGQIKASADAHARLIEYRQRCRAALEEQAEHAAAAADVIKRSHLEEAVSLELDGQLPEALDALHRGLAVIPDDADLLSAAVEVRGKIAAAQEQREREERFRQWLDQGRQLSAQGDHEAAASVFRRAVSMRPQDLRAQRMLAQEREILRLQLEEHRNAEELKSRIEEDLAAARNRKTAGDIAGAMTVLQSVLALAPNNSEAKTLQDSLDEQLRAQLDTEADRRRRHQTERLLRQAREHMAASDLAAALKSANDLLALDPNNREGIELVMLAYSSLTPRTSLADRLPPRVIFTDRDDFQPDHTPFKLVDTASFRLGGLVLSDSPFEIVANDDQGNLLSVEVSYDSSGLSQFHIPLQLRAGLQTVLVEAVGEHGLKCSHSFQLNYVPPWWQTWRAGQATALLLGGLTITGWIARRWRRRRLLQRRFNPYMAGAPILKDEDFYGRNVLLDRVMQSLPNNSILLFGERRIGKTSFQHQLRRRLQEIDDPDYAFFPVFIDLQGTPESRFFATLGDEIWSELGDRLSSLARRHPLDEEGYGYRDLLQDLRQVLKALRGLTPKTAKLVLLIDEVDELNDYDPRVNQRLRSLFMKTFAENLVAVVSGVQIKKHWEREGSPWFNFFEEIELRPFRDDDARQLIERPIRGVLRLEPGLTERIIAATQGKPYMIQRLCMAMVQHCHEDGRDELSSRDFEATLPAKDAA